MEKNPDFHGRHIEVPEKIQEFCLFDSGSSDPEKMLLFGEDVMVATLSNFWDTCLGDGTFKVCPSEFYQLYPIHFLIEGYYRSCIHALLSHKNDSTYRVLLALIKDFSDNCVPSRILMESEKAAINASKKPIRKAVSVDATSVCAKLFSGKLLTLIKKFLPEEWRYCCRIENDTCVSIHSSCLSRQSDRTCSR